jgi:tetratricopeptide (TPR) repeat protein
MKLFCLLGCLGILFILCGVETRTARATTSAQEQTQSPEKTKISDLGLGEEITAEDVQSLEDSLLSNPDSLFVRSKLIHYYFEVGLSSVSPELEAKREQHIFWLIEHHPESTLAGSGDAEIDNFAPRGSKDAFQRAKASWLQQSERHPDDLRVLHNAAEFFWLSDSKSALEVLQKAVNLDPNDADTLDLLARTYEGERIQAKLPEENKALAEKALTVRERELEKLEGPRRYLALVQMATDAFDTGDMGKAEQYASELLQGVKEGKSGWNDGNETHYANIVLGRVALRRGDIVGAKQHLLAAGETTGSPNLNSFGPNMALAKELLEKGERDTVITYLQSCAKFWKMGGAELQNWIAMIKRGGTPDFGANLDY